MKHYKKVKKTAVYCAKWKTLTQVDLAKLCNRLYKRQFRQAISSNEQAMLDKTDTNFLSINYRCKIDPACNRDKHYH